MGNFQPFIMGILASFFTLPDNELSFHVRNSLREYIINHPYLARKRWREIVYGEGPISDPETEKEENKR
ncbi:hypothetical protein [Desulfitobacterium hafniense]|uniref:hypothetical protein n=1 Tax=Desulfitobacterium hafniense TaxID=49338 RepID=UPI001FA7E541|nr:hypothetical protein [Desulfitobacterium hafniense]